MPPRRTVAGIVAAAALVAGGVVAATTAQAASGCRVDYTVTSQWPGGFGAQVSVTNLGSAVSSWTVDWTYSAGQKVTQLWNGNVTTSGTTVTVTNAPYNGSIPTNGHADFGFNGSWTTSNPVPAQFRLNGTECTGTVTAPSTTAVPTVTPTPTATTTPKPTATPTPTPTTTPKPTATPTPSTSPTPTVTPTPTPTVTVTPTPTPTATATPTPSGDFFLNTSTQAYTAYQKATGTDKQLLAKIALTPSAYWVGNWSDAAHSKAEVQDYTSRAVAAGKIPFFVVYAIPGRDCGNYSSGGVGTSEYASWIDTVSSGISGHPWVVLEPDALAQLGDCDGQGDRVGYLQYAAKSLTQAGARVYIDAGHSGWLSADEAARRLNLVGFQYAVGFALNTSNFGSTSSEQAFGEQISAKVGGKGYVIDTSRNGNGSNGEWCNPSGRALGDKPVLVNDSTGLDAKLWVKPPGESDGTCNGGPAAGQWFQSYALDLARNTSW